MHLSPEWPKGRGPNQNPLKTKTLLLLSAVISAAQTALAQTNAAPDSVVSAATISRPARNTVATASTDARIQLDPQEVVSLNLTFSRPTEPIRFVAPNGGSINGQGGNVTVSPAASGSSVPVSFTVGKSRGLYTLEMNQGTRTQIFEFWVGTEPPTGRPGPNLHFTGSR